MLCLFGIEPLQYDENRRVPFMQDTQYTRNEYHWWIKNTGEASKLYLNNIYQSQEMGTNSLDLLDVWYFQPYVTNINIGIVDMASNHGFGVRELINLVSPGANTHLWSSLRLNAGDISGGISNFT